MRWVLSMLVLCACGDEGDEVTCTTGTLVGASLVDVASVQALGDQIYIVGADVEAMRTVLVVDATTRELVAEWQWPHAGTLVGTAAAPGLIDQSAFYAIDPATGALGAARPYVQEFTPRGSCTIEDATHVVFGPDYGVLDATGTVVRKVPLGTPSTIQPEATSFAFFATGVAGMGALDDKLRFTKWDATGTLAAERTYTAAELGVASADRVGFTRAGDGMALVRQTGSGVEVVPLSETFELATAIATATPAFTEVGAQGGGASTIGVENTAFAGAHVTSDGAVTQFASSCTHSLAAPPIAAFAPDNATAPIFVFHVGGRVFVGGLE